MVKTRSKKEPFLDHENKSSVEPIVVEQRETRSRKKRRMEDKNKDTNDVDMVDQAETTTISTLLVQKKDELKRVGIEVAQEIEESKDGELKDKRQRKKNMKGKANDEHKLERVVENVVEDKKKGGKENSMQENANDKDGAKIKDKTGIKSIRKSERGKGLFQRVKETIRPLLNVSTFDDITSSDNDKNVIRSRKHQQEKPAIVVIDESKQPKKKRKNKSKSVEADSEIGRTEDPTVQEKEVHDKLQQEKPAIVVIDENKQPKKKRKNKSVEADSEIGRTEDPTIQEKEVHDKLQQEKPGTVVTEKKKQPKKKRKRKDKRISLEADSEIGVQTKSQTVKEKEVDNLLVASVGKSLNLFLKRKLLVLDINGLLADVVFPAPKNCTPDRKTAGRAIFMRPFYVDFLNFCFERFDVAIWSSRTKRIIDLVVECLLGELKQKLIFCWDQSHCTPTNDKTLENQHKPLLFKELGKIWKNKNPNLPWEKGVYNKSNTLLIDDSPYKAFLNPKNTAIFPPSFTYLDKQDSSLGPGGDIRVYLEKLAEAEDIQKFVEQNPFGQVGIDENHESYYSFYSKFETLRSVD